LFLTLAAVLQSALSKTWAVTLKIRRRFGYIKMWIYEESGLKLIAGFIKQSINW
jgi:hypothetical protein